MCVRMLQVASVSLDLTDSHLDEQDVADGTAWSLLRRQLPRALFHFVVAGLPSSTCAPPFRDPQRVFGIPKSTHPSQVERMRSEPQRRAALCVHGRGAFLFCSRDPAWVPRPCLNWRPLSSWHVPEPGAPTSGYRHLVPIAPTSRQWKPCTDPGHGD